MIAMALSCQPELLIADEPTTALDVTIQAQILDELKRLQKQTGTAIMLITHDLGVVADMAQKVLVMYAGKVVEYADTIDIFSRPLHPYTEGLLKSIPRLNQSVERKTNRQCWCATIEKYVVGGIRRDRRRRLQHERAGYN